MKLTLPANELEEAVKNYLSDTYSIYGEVLVDISNSVEVELNPLSTSTDKFLAEYNKDSEVVPEEDDREWAETRANELGINFRSDIKTSTLITRIEEMEEELAKQAKNPDPLPMDEPEYEETQYEEVQEEVTETEEAIEDEPETEEKPVQSKKPSIFDAKR